MKRQELLEDGQILVASVGAGLTKVPVVPAQPSQLYDEARAIADKAAELFTAFHTGCAPGFYEGLKKEMRELLG